MYGTKKKNCIQKQMQYAFYPDEYSDEYFPYLNLIINLFFFIKIILDRIYYIYFYIKTQ
jgi:hypothetical protein